MGFNNIISNLFTQQPYQYVGRTPANGQEFEGWFLCGYSQILSLQVSNILTLDNGVTFKNGDFGKIINGDGSATIFNNKTIQLQRNSANPTFMINLLALSMRYSLKEFTIFSFPLAPGVMVQTNQFLTIQPGFIRIRVGE
jgi:hypothetical protein